MPELLKNNLYENIPPQDEGLIVEHQIQPN